MNAKNNQIIRIFSALIVITAVCIQPVFADDVLDVYLSKPKDGISPYSDVTTETFESLTPGTYSNNYVSAIGTYQLSSTSKIKVVANDIYGAGTGNYMAFGSQSSSSGPITLNFNAPQSYFGFTWCAGDANNSVSFYNGDTLIGRYKTSNILSILSKSTVTTLDGSTYNSKDYYGQPQTGKNTSEPYAFLNFIDNKGSFTKVVFENNNTTGTGFESDNHTIRTTAPTALGSFVSVGQTSATGVTSSLPEPTTIALLVLGIAGGAMVRRKRLSNN